MPTYGQWATPAGPAIGIDVRPTTSFLSTGSGWIPGGPNWSNASMAGNMKGGGIADTPMFNSALNMFVSSQTGKPFTGKHPQTGQSYVNGQPTGVQVPYGGGREINPNDPNQRYQAVNIQRNPELANIARDLADQLAKTANDNLLSFNEYKKEFESELASAKAKSAAATDIGPFTNEMRGYQSRYETALDAASRDYADVNARTAAAERAIVQEARDLIPSYDRAAQDAANLQLAALQRNVSRYRAASGVPTGMGSNEQALLAREAANILVPMEQAKIAQRYNILDRYVMPTTLDIANRETAKAAQFDPMIAAQKFQSGTATAQTIQQLSMATANMAREDAVRFMMAIGVPEQIQQQIVSGNIANAIALNQLFSQSRYQGLQDILGAQISQPIGTTFVAPGYFGSSRYSPFTQGTGSTTAGLKASNAPVEVSPQYPGSAIDRSGRTLPGDMVWDANNQVWRNKNTGQVIGYSRYMSPTATSRMPTGTGSATGADSNSRYNAATGQLVDQFTGLPTGYGAGGVNPNLPPTLVSATRYSTPASQYLPSDNTYPYWEGGSPGWPSATGPEASMGPGTLGRLVTDPAYREWLSYRSGVAL